MKNNQMISFIFLTMSMISCSSSVAITQQKEPTMISLVNTDGLKAECDGMVIRPCPNFIKEWDEGYKKWAIILKNFENTDIPKCEIKRLFQERTDDGFSLLGSGFFPALILRGSPDPNLNNDLQNKEVLANPAIIFSERGFLPGEKVTIRVKKDGDTHYDTISFYPVPLVLKDSFGNELMNAEIVSVCPTTYDLKIAYNESNRLVKFGSYKENEKKEEYVYQTEPLLAFCTVATDDTIGGIIHLKLFYQDGSSYEMDLPWGNELTPYVQGKVNSLEK